MRHTLKPQAYLRYGDDVIIIGSSRRQTRQFRTQASEFLGSELGLGLHAHNDVIVPVASGVHFLGHVVTSNYAVVDQYTSRAALEKVQYHNISSYTSLQLAKYVKQQLYWQLLDELEEAGIA